MTSFLNVAIDGTAYGMVLFIIAVGMSLTLGLMRFVNLSHGAFAMLGGYGTALLIREAGLGFFSAFFSGCIGHSTYWCGSRGFGVEAFVSAHTA